MTAEAAILDFTAIQNKIMKQWMPFIMGDILGGLYYRKIKAAKDRDERVQLYKEYCTSTGLPIDRKFMDTL